MATIGAVINALVEVLKPKFDDLVVDNSAITAKIGEGWPPERAIQAVTNKNSVVIGITDRFGTLNNQFRPRRLGAEKLPIGIASVINKTTIEPGETATITLSIADGQTAVLNKDAVSLVIRYQGQIEGAVGIAVTGDTLSTLAAKLATDIGAELQNISASSSGAVVTITNNKSARLKLESYTGNVGYSYKELARESAQIQIVCWCGSFTIRRAVADILEVELARLRASRGFAVPTGEPVRVLGVNKFTMPNDKDISADVYRRDFLIDVEYGITAVDEMWSVLIPISSISPL